jgi:RNA 2',3'-cyclic 3'-phosphodiesterase
MVKLFIYGSLKEAKVQKEILGRCLEMEEATLLDYSTNKLLIDGIEYISIVEKKGNKVNGKLTEVSEEELREIDNYEGKDYIRIKVNVEGKEAFAYKKNEKIRAFIAITFPEEVIGEVERVQELLGKVLFNGKMTELANIHLTLKFLGRIDEDRLETIKEKLAGIEFNKMSLKLGRMGYFGYRGMPSIVWIKIEGKEIYELQKKIEEVLEGENFKKEGRFMGHLTIARVKYVKDKSRFIENIKNINVKSIDFKQNNFCFMKSNLYPTGPIYEEIMNYNYKER